MAAIESIFLFKKTIILKYFNNQYSDKLNLSILKKSNCIKIVNAYKTNKNKFDKTYSKIILI